MTDILQEQRDFMTACDQERNLKNVLLYCNLIKEEGSTELDEAVAQFKSAKTEEELRAAVTELADVAFDTIYVASGLLNVLFDKPEEVWVEGQRSNMAKVNPLTGKVIKNESGKVQKPAGWTPPDFRAIVDANWPRIREVLNS